MIPKVQLKAVSKSFTGILSESDVHAVNNITLDIGTGEFFALLGPSGCGKSTTLRLIAGFEQPTSGEIIINGKNMTGVAPYHRPVNTVFQDYALFPHMTILKNVMFGLRMEGVSNKDAQKRAHEALELVQLPDVARRKPSEISGGQQQRVALARALVKQPDVLLLDEPLGALDLKLRRQMQLELKALQREIGITFIFVTHDQEEAMTMANRIAVMNAGDVLQVGRADEIYERPVNRFVAEFIGETNFVQVEARMLAIRPERIQIHPEDKGALQGQIVDVHYIGTDIRYMVQLDDTQTLTVRTQNTDPIRQGVLRLHERVSVRWDERYAQELRN